VSFGGFGSKKTEHLPQTEAAFAKELFLMSIRQTENPGLTPVGCVLVLGEIRKSSKHFDHRAAREIHNQRTAGYGVGPYRAQGLAHRVLREIHAYTLPYKECLLREIVAGVGQHIAKLVLLEIDLSKPDMWRNVYRSILKPALLELLRGSIIDLKHFPAAKK